jgi:hypothetical protein
MPVYGPDDPYLPGIGQVCRPEFTGVKTQIRLLRAGIMNGSRATANTTALLVDALMALVNYQWGRWDDDTRTLALYLVNRAFGVLERIYGLSQDTELAGDSELADLYLQIPSFLLVLIDVLGGGDGDV